MATCPKCQTFNDEDSAVCVTCGQVISRGWFGLRGLLRNLVKNISIPSDMPKEFLEVACKIELHSGEWAYVDPDQCNQIRVCGGCGTQSFRHNHQVIDWVSDWTSSNRQTGVCNRCSQMVSRTKPSDGGPKAM